MEERAFQKVLKNVRGSTSRDDLANAVLAGLQLALQSPENGQLLANLQAKAASITKNIPAGDAGANSSEIRQATIRCIVLLETAQKKEATPSTTPKWPKIVLISVMAATALLYLVLLATRDL